jgi:hypothetical protein
MIGTGIGIHPIRSQDTQMSSSFSDRLDLIKHVFAGVTITSMFVFAIIGFVYVTLANRLRRDIHNAAVCDEACAVINSRSVDLRSINQTDSCWCGDNELSLKTIPLTWEYKKGETKSSNGN